MDDSPNGEGREQVSWLRPNMYVRNLMPTYTQVGIAVSMLASYVGLPGLRYLYPMGIDLLC